MYGVETMSMSIIQLVVIVIFACNFAVSTMKHGDVKEHPFNTYNIWITTLRIIICSLVLYWGGFWQ